jgi:hypothetical protein
MSLSSDLLPRIGFSYARWQVVGNLIAFTPEMEAVSGKW